MLTGRLSCCFRLSVRSSWTAAAAAVRSVSPPRLKHRPAPPRSNSRRLRTRPSSLTKRKTLQLFCPSPARATRSLRHLFSGKGRLFLFLFLITRSLSPLLSCGASPPFTPLRGLLSSFQEVSSLPLHKSRNSFQGSEWTLPSNICNYV